MSCVKFSIGIHRKIRRIALPTLFGSMALVASVAVVLGWKTLDASLGAGHWGRLVSEYFWISFWIGVAALLALFVALALVWWLSRAIAHPISLLANRADELTRCGGTAHFPDKTGICEVDQLSASFNRLFALQEQQSIELRNLIQNVLHDIRAPINHIAQQAECIYDGSCDPQDAAGLITESCDKVIQLFETHAEIARNNSFAETAPASPQDLLGIVRFMVELYLPVAEMKGVRLSGPDERSQPVVIAGHKGKFERLIGNLVDNAIKFTPSGGSVAVTVSDTSADVILSVSDTGIGIAPDSLQHVFDRYFRDKTATTHAGSGLGLTLVQSIVTFYHGAVDCTSVLGQGTTFTVRLPHEPKEAK